MRTRVLLLLAALAAVQSAGCCHRCCGPRDRDDRIPPPRERLRPDGLPPAALPPAGGAAPAPTGAYGGS